MSPLPCPKRPIPIRPDGAAWLAVYVWEYDLHLPVSKLAQLSLLFLLRSTCSRLLRLARDFVAVVAMGIILGAPSPAAAETPSEMWMQATALVRGGNARAAIPILDRLVTLVPDEASIRLELGLAHFLSGDDRRAGHHIRQALAGHLSEAETRGAQTLLQRIEARRRWSASFGLAIIPQTNAGRHTTEETVVIGGLPFRLAQTASPGVGVAPTARFTYAPRLTAKLWGTATLGFGGALYRRSDLNDYSLLAEMGLSRRDGAGREVGAGILATQRWVGNARYWHEAGLYLTATSRPTDTTRFVLRGERAERRARNRPGLDGSVWRFAAVGERVLTPQMAIFVRGQAVITDVANAHESGTRFGLGVGATRLFPGGWRTTVQANLGRDRRNGPAPFFGVVRRDTDVRLSSQILNRGLQWRGLAPVLELGYERRRSNIRIERFTNTYVSVGVTRNF